MFFFLSLSITLDIMNFFFNVFIVYILRVGYWVYLDNLFEFLECVIGFLNVEVEG